MQNFGSPVWSAITLWSANTLYVKCHHTVCEVPSHCMWSANTLYVKCHHTVCEVPTHCMWSANTLYVKCQHTVCEVPTHCIHENCHQRRHFCTLCSFRIYAECCISNRGCYSNSNRGCYSKTVGCLQQRVLQKQKYLESPDKETKRTKYV
jgi:hypothetical protein